MSLKEKNFDTFWDFITDKTMIQLGILFVIAL